MNPLLASLLLLLPLPPTPQPGIELPAGPVARAWAGVGAETTPVNLGETLLAAHPWLADPANAKPEQRWSSWAEWLGAEASAGTPDPKRRVGLLLLAREQGRWRDAWVHLERLGGFPHWAAAAMPRLLPGVPGDAPRGRGGLPGPLPSGVLLAPAPPPSLEAPLPLRGTRSASIEGLRIGEAIVTFTISVEPSGVEVDLLHTGGGPATVRVLLPTPAGQEIRVEYIDWMRQDEVGLPLTVELLPGEEEHNLFGRFHPRREPLPSSPKGALPQQLLRGGLWIECSEGHPAEARARAAAAALGLLLEVPTGLRRPGAPVPSNPWSATVLHLPAEESEAIRFLARIASATESRLSGGGE